MFSPLLTSALPAFLASLVEFVEALTIVLAVGVTRGWRSALLGSVAGVALLAASVVALGPALRAFPISILQLTIGVLLLFFGMRWLRKAILRQAGVVPLHDENAIFARERERLRTAGSGLAVDWIGATTAFKAVVLEGLEVVFIVIAIGATADRLVPASLGATAAGVLVILSGVLLHKPLARVPENALKFTVGILLSAFGTFWTAKGLRFNWPGDDAALLWIIGCFLAVSGLSVVLARTAKSSASARA